MVVSYEILGLRIIKIKRWERLIIYRYFNVNIICYKWGYLDIKLLGKKLIIYGWDYLEFVEDLRKDLYFYWNKKWV